MVIKHTRTMRGQRRSQFFVHTQLSRGCLFKGKKLTSNIQGLHHQKLTKLLHKASPFEEDITVQASVHVAFVRGQLPLCLSNKWSIGDRTGGTNPKFPKYTGSRRMEFVWGYNPLFDTQWILGSQVILRFEDGLDGRSLVICKVSRVSQQGELYMDLERNFY